MRTTLIATAALMAASSAALTGGYDNTVVTPRPPAPIATPAPQPPMVADTSPMFAPPDIVAATTVGDPGTFGALAGTGAAVPLGALALMLIIGQNDGDDDTGLEPILD